MRHSILMYLFGVTFLLFGCTEDTLFDSNLDQIDQKKTSVKMEKTPFTGTSKFFAPGESGKVTLLPNGKVLVKGATVVFYEEATDWRVTGKSFWYINQKVELDGVVKFWGKSYIIVADENDEDGSRGRWEVSWHGYITQYGIEAEAVGTGKDGEVKGLTAKWSYTMDFNDGYYKFTGYVQGKNY